MTKKSLIFITAVFLKHFPKFHLEKAIHRVHKILARFIQNYLSLILNPRTKALLKSSQFNVSFTQVASNLLTA